MTFHRSLTDNPRSSEPNAQDGEPNGAFDAELERAPSQVERTHAIGEPGTLPPTWCKRCQAVVLPEEKGVCPRCHTFLKLNFVRRRHPVNKLRREQLRDEYLADYRPTTRRLRLTCEQLAGIDEQLESLKPGSVEHQRLVQLSQQLGAVLEAARPKDPSPSIEAMTPADVVAKLKSMLADAEKFEAQQAKPKPEPPPFFAEPHDESTLTTEPETAPEPPAAACPFCFAQPCIGPSDPNFRALHANAPEEIERRSEALTKTMFATVKFGHRGLY